MSKSMVEVAQATITIIPTMKGAQASITEEMTGASTIAGDVAGKAAGTSMSSSMDKTFKGVGSTLTKGLTVPVLGAAAGAVAAWKSVDDAMDTITTKTGSTGDALSSMQGIAKNIATSLPVSFQNAGDAVGEVNTRFGVTGDALQDLSTDFLKFSKINNTDVSTSVDNVSKVISSFKLSASDTSGVLDALNTVGQQTGVSVDTLSSEMATNSAYFNEMGMSAADAANFLGTVDKAGMDSSQALVGLKTAMKNANKDGVSLNEKLSEFSQTMKGNGSDTDKLAASYDLFGSKAGAAIYNAASSGKLDLENLTGSLTGFGGSVSNTFDTTQDPLDKFTSILNDLKLKGADLVETSGPAIVSALGTVSNVLKGVGDVWNGMSPGMQEGIIKIALVGATVGPVISTVLKFKEGIDLLKGGFSLLSGAGGIGGMLTAVGPFLPWIALAVGAVIGIVAVIQNWGSISQWFGDTWSNICNGVMGIWDDVNGKFSDSINWIKGLFNFQWEWPSIPLPHFSFSGSINPLDWWSQGLPSIGVDWYAKAATAGAVFNSPQLIGVGDAKQGEMLIGENTLFNMIKEASGNGKGFTQNNNYYSPQALDPSEAARMTKNATRSMVLSLQGAK